MLKTFEGYYVKGDYPNALLTLQKNASTLSKGLYHYNSGTVEAQMKNWPMARYHFLMASEHGFSGSELSTNLKITENNLTVEKDEKPIGSFDYFVKGSLIASQGFLTMLSLLILVIGLWTLRKKQDTQKVLVFLVLVLIPLGLNVWIHSWNRMIITQPQLLQDGPSGIFGSRGELPVGVLIITKPSNGWHEIVYPTRFQGWIKNSGVRALE